MLRHVQHTKENDPWVTDVLPLLPPDLDALAARTGAYRRHRAFADAASLLRAVLAYALTCSSFRQLGAWAVITRLADLAPSAWLVRLRAATPFLQALLAHRLHQPRPRWLSQAVRGRVLLLDATAIRYQQGSGDDARLHVAYDLLTGQLDQLLLSDRHTGEHVRHFSLRAGDLLVADAGYGFREHVTVAHDAQADVVVRIYPPQFPLEHSDGRALDVRAWLDSCRGDQTSRLAYYRHGSRRVRVRVLAWRLGEVQRRAAQARAKARAKRKQRAFSSVVQYYADWQLLVTTLPEGEEWPDSAVWRLYAARWQVELLFKRIKQQLGLGELRVRTAASAMALVWALLLAWLLQEDEQREMSQALQGLAKAAPRTLPGQLPGQEAVVSVWGVRGVLLETLRQAVRGTWRKADVEAAWPRLGRYLVTHPRADREHQATEVVAWLSGVRRTPRRPLGSAV